MSTADLKNWVFDPPEHHAATNDGSCMAGPTLAYFRVWARRSTDGKCVCGIGETEEAALKDCQYNATRCDLAAYAVAREIAAHFRLPDDAIPSLIREVEKHAMMHKLMHQHGLFYP